MLREAFWVEVRGLALNCRGFIYPCRQQAPIATKLKHPKTQLIPLKGSAVRLVLEMAFKLYVMENGSEPAAAKLAGMADFVGVAKAKIL